MFGRQGLPEIDAKDVNNLKWIQVFWKVCKYDNASDEDIVLNYSNYSRV